MLQSIRDNTKRLVNYCIMILSIIRGFVVSAAWTLGNYDRWATLGNLSLPFGNNIGGFKNFMRIKLSLRKDSNISFFGTDSVELDLEDYISGCVAQEIGNAHIEACRAQAIAARTNC